MVKKQALNFRNASQIIVGCFILAFSVSVFVLPFNILSGGVAGIAVAFSAL